MHVICTQFLNNSFNSNKIISLVTPWISSWWINASMARRAARRMGLGWRAIAMLIFAGVSSGSYIWHGGSLPNSSVRPAARRHSPRTVARDLAPRRRRLHGWTRIDRTARPKRSRRRMEIDGLLPNQSGRHGRRQVPAAVWECTGRASEWATERQTEPGLPHVCLACSLAGVPHRSTDCCGKTEVSTFYSIIISSYAEFGVCWPFLRYTIMLSYFGANFPTF